MERDYGKEIDALCEQLNEIRSLLISGEVRSDPVVQEDTHEADSITAMSSDERMNSLMADCEEQQKETGGTGAVTYLGVFASGGRQSNWMNKDLSTDILLKLAHPETGTAGKVLACISSEEKLRILTALLHRPMTVAQLCTEAGFNSTGQAYYHLNTLLSYGFVEEDPYGKNQYCIPGHRVQGIMMILAGIHDLVKGNAGG